MRTPYDKFRMLMGRMLGSTHGGARDLYGAFGYKPELTPQDFMDLYLRNGVASRIVRAFPQATWRDVPLIRDEEGDSSKKQVNGRANDNYSAFVEAVEDLFDAHQVTHYLERADRLSGIGRFGILILGFDDGNRLSDPLPPGQHKLTYLQAYGEPRVTIQRYETDPADPRYSLPVMYQVQPSSSIRGGSQVQTTTFQVHHSRVIHLAEHLDENEVLGTPRLMPVYNHLQDLEKVVGGGAETFWLNARGGLALTADKDVDLDEKALQDMKEQAFEFEHQLRRILALQGATAQAINSNVADPKPNVESLLQLIAGGIGIPLRILVGSERGELSSTQDENNWASRIDERQEGYATPRILRPLVQRLIDTGNLPSPKGVWWVEWPSSASLSPAQEAEISLKRTQALAAYSNSPNAELFVPAPEFRSRFLGLDPESQYDRDDEGLDDLPGDPVTDVIAGGDTEVAATALNGAQIASLKSIVEAVGLGAMAPETAITLIGVGFPQVPVETARKIIEPMIGFTPTTPAPTDVIEVAANQAVLTVNQLMKPWRDFGDYRMHTNAGPRTLYVSRPVLNAEEIREHFRQQGIDPMTPADEMHVTIAYSRRPVDWMKIGTEWAGSVEETRDGTLLVAPGGARMMDLFGTERNVLVLAFSSTRLSWRHEEFLRIGASWDHPDYNPHITITYDVAQSWGNRGPFDTRRRWDERLKALEPWQGRIHLGPEVFREINEEWKSQLKENARV